VKPPFVNRHGELRVIARTNCVTTKRVGTLRELMQEHVIKLGL
jgi:hypothetical protein